MRLIRIALAIVTALAVQSVRASTWSDLFIFGDSLADTGNNAALIDSGLLILNGIRPGARTTTPLAAGSNVAPSLPYAGSGVSGADVYSNGKVWTQYFAESLGLRAEAWLDGGGNFAFGGARSGMPFDSDVPALTAQVDYFLDGSGNVAPASALYVVQGGGNDARDVLDAAADADPLTDPRALVGAYAANIAGIVGQLQASGARDFLVVNVPDIGMAPALLAAGPTAAGFGSSFADMMNVALDTALNALPPVAGGRLYRMDLFGLMNQVAADPADFGFTDMTSMCAFSAACIADPSSTFFWDGLHPTTAAHALLGSQAAMLVPEPQTYALMIAGLLLLGFAARRRTKHSN